MMAPATSCSQVQMASATAPSRAPRPHSCFPAAVGHRSISLKTACPLIRRQVQLHRQAQFSGKAAASNTQRQVQASAATQAGVADLKQRYDIPNHVEVVEGTNGLTKVALTHACGASAEVYLYGACVTSWKQPSGDEVLYVRSDAVFDGKKPISGGIPLCFPQFGPGPMQQHGFARNLAWSIGSTSADPNPDDREPSVELVLEDNDYTRAMWPHQFRAVYTVTLHGEALRTDLRVINTGDKPFDFTAAIHTYIEVLDIGAAKVKGLTGLTYLDKVKDPKNPTKSKEEREEVIFKGPVDSVYLNAKDYVELEVGTGAAVAISSNGWDDVVVWSPWTSMENDFRRFCCVENAKFSKPAHVAPGESWRAQAELDVVDVE